MQLHYFWIDQWKYFSKKGINLSAKYQFHLQLKPKPGGYAALLAITLNPDYIENFFEKPRVTNVTALIGKNGSGKSSVLNYIKAFFPEGLQANLSSDLIVYGAGQEENERLYVLYPIHWDIQINAGDIRVITQEYSGSILDGHSIRTDAQLDHIDYIYYSYILDFQHETSDWKGLYNLSTTALIEETRRAAMAEVNPRVASDVKSTDLDYLIGNEVSKGLQFLISEYKGLLPFDKPPTLDVFIDSDDEDHFKLAANKDGDVQELLHHLNTRTFDPPEEQDAVALGMDIFCKALLANFFLTERRYSAGIQAVHVMNFGEKETVRDFVLRFFEHLKFEKVSVYDQKDIHPYSRYMELSSWAPQLIRNFEELILHRFITVKEKTGRAFIEYEFSLREGTDTAFERFFQLYLKVKGLTPFLRFGWRGLSTGEQSFLSFMSRFVHLKRHQIGNDQLKNNLVIMIDEGDAGFHPAWQKQFFKLSLDFLSSLFKDHHIQLIYTANAPFLTSDLPKSHILFMEKESTTNTIIHDRDNDRMQTFGANIHQLFMDSFYMDGIVMGDFAKDKIDGIIIYLNNKRIKKPDEKMKRIIAQIGEPLIRRKLQAMWEEKFGIQSEMDDLLQRMAVLKAEQKQKNQRRIKRKK